MQDFTHCCLINHHPIVKRIRVGFKKKKKCCKPCKCKMMKWKINKPLVPKKGSSLPLIWAETLGGSKHFPLCRTLIFFFQKKMCIVLHSFIQNHERKNWIILKNVPLLKSLKSLSETLFCFLISCLPMLAGYPLYYVSSGTTEIEKWIYQAMKKPLWCQWWSRDIHM